jgi:hypothetical protein
MEMGNHKKKSTLTFLNKLTIQNIQQQLTLLIHATQSNTQEVTNIDQFIKILIFKEEKNFTFNTKLHCQVQHNIKWTTPGTVSKIISVKYFFISLLLSGHLTSFSWIYTNSVYKSQTLLILLCQTQSVHTIHT